MRVTNLQKLLHKFKYQEFIEQALKYDWKIASYVNSSVYKDDDRVILLGHRVNDDLAKTKRMSYIEFDLGIESTYFLLTSAPEMIREGVYYMNYLWQLNRETNLMVDCIEIVAKYVENLHDHIIGNLMLMKNYGIISKGIAMSNDSDMSVQSGFKGIHYFYNFSETEGYISIGSQMGKEKLINFGVHPLAEYSLLYEESMIKGKHTITDHKGQMSIDGKPVGRKKAKDELFQFLRMNTGKTVVSFDPEYWNV